MEWPKHVEIAKPWYLRQALQIATYSLLAQNRARHHFRLQQGKACLLHLAADGPLLQEGELDEGFLLDDFLRACTEGTKVVFSLLISLSLQSHTGVSPDMWHRAHVSSNEPFHRKLETGYPHSTSSLCFAPPHPLPLLPNQCLGPRDWSRRIPGPAKLLLSLSFIFFVFSP